MPLNREQLKEILISQQERQRLPVTLIERTSYQEINQYFKNPHAVIVKGVRRCGKSTLLGQLLQRNAYGKYYYFNFEDERLLSFTVEDFSKLHEVMVELYGERRIFYFDEIQNIQNWEVYVRRMQDSGYKFFITGSNASLLSKEMGTSLTGRHVDFELFPFSFSEFLHFKQWQFSSQQFYDPVLRGQLRNLFNEYLEGGGMPEFLHYQQQTLLSQVYEDILFRDIISRHEINGIKALRELGLYLITNMARLFSYTKIKNVLQLGSVNTVKNYIGYFEDCYLLSTINQFSYSLKEQLITNKKSYVVDNGLANAIAFQFSRNKGQFLENIVFTELLRRYHKNVYFYKTKNNLEVDFIVQHQQKITLLIQVCFQLEDEATKKREITALLKAMEETGLKQGLILTNEHQEELNINGMIINIMPVYQWLLKA